MEKNKGPTFKVFIPEHLADKIDAYDEIVKVFEGQDSGTALRVSSSMNIACKILKIIERVKK